MSTLLPDPSSMAVTIGGVAYPLAVVGSCLDTLAPEVDSCGITVPWGDRLIHGAAAPSESLPALNAEVVVTCGGYVWRGLLASRHRSASGSRRTLRLTARGPGLAMDRAYLPSFARSGLSGVIQTPGGPRFAPGTRSASADGPSLTYRLGGTGSWTVAQALGSYLVHASAYAGLPPLTLDAGSSDLARVLPDTDTDGGSVHAGVQAILGHRLGLSWRALLTAGGWSVRVRGLTGTGLVIDLTTADVLDYEVGEDATAALADLEVRGARKQYVVSIDSDGSGDLVADWSADDVATRAVGDRGSPAYRRFTLATFALPDGSPSTTAEPVPTLPIAVASSLASGSSPWLLFAQLADSTWISLQGICSVSVAGGRVWIEGLSPAEWDTWLRIRLTLCLAPRAHLVAMRTGGSGLGRGLSIIGSRHAYASAAAVRVSGASLASVTGTAVSEQQPIDDQAAALWASLSGPQVIASWTRDGIAGGGPDPGDRITSLILPGGAATTVVCDAVCSSRSVSWSSGRPRTTWQISPRPFSSGALVR